MIPRINDNINRAFFNSRFSRTILSMQEPTHQPMPNRRFCVAPMMDATDRHCRYFLRLISHHALLYTEMLTSAAIVHGDRDRLLGFDPMEHPVALQIGGSDPQQMADAALIGEDFGYDEINMNVGCPSQRVQDGRFGACLMTEPERVAQCIAAMQAQVSIPVTVKCRIGVDHMDSYEELAQFIATIAQAKCNSVIVHARKAYLKGLNPKQNRNIPPLDYDRVYRLKNDFNDLEVIINGGITTLDDSSRHLHYVDGVMLGREAYHNPYLLKDVDALYYGHQETPRSREDVVEAMIPYLDQHAADGVRLSNMTRHLMGLYLGQPAARVWRRYLGEHARDNPQGGKVLSHALTAMSTAITHAA